MASSSIRVTRGWDGLVRARPFAVEIDGTVVGTVGAQQSEEFACEPGRHKIVVRSGHHISKTRTFEVAPEECVNFSCRAAYMAWPIFLASLVKPDLAITLRRR